MTNVKFPIGGEKIYYLINGVETTNQSFEKIKWDARLTLYPKMDFFNIILKNEDFQN